MKKLLIILLVIPLMLFFVMCMPPVAEPQFDPSAGEVPQGTTITITTSTEGASIYYTTGDGTQADPTAETGTLYSETTKPTINNATTVKAIAIKEGMANSSVVSASYTVKVATPTFIPNGGEVAYGSTVTINCSTTGATIYYTLDGNDPTQTSEQYSITNKPEITADNQVLKAKAYKTGMVSSDVSSATFTLSNSTLTINIIGTGTVAVSVNGTPATGSSPYTIKSGSTVVLTASDDASFDFSEWTGDLTGTDNPATFTMSGNMTITAVFINVAPETLPYSENFDSLTAPNLPEFWTIENVVGELPTWITEAGTGTTGNCLKYPYSYSGQGNKQRVILKEFDMSSATTGDAYLIFALKQPTWATPPRVEEIKVFVKIGTTGTWTSVAEFTTSSQNFATQLVSLTGTQNQSSVFVAFEGTNRNGWSAFIDDISILATLPTPDAPTNATAALGSGTGDINISWTEPATLPVDGYNVYRATTSGGPYTKANPSIIPVGTTTYTDNVGNGTYYYVVRSQNLGIVESANSNETTGVTVSGAGLIIGTGVETGHNLTVDDYWHDVYTQQIYLKSELGDQPSKKIDGIKLKIQVSNATAWSNPVTIYIGHTTKTQFNTSVDWISSGLTQVWSGNIDVSGLAVGTLYEITFTTPFNYNNTDNLVIAFDQDDGDFGSNHSGFAGTSGTARALYASSSSGDIDPANPPAWGTLTNVFPNIVFMLSNQ